MQESHENFNPEQTEKFNELMRTAPALGETEKLDNARMKWLSEMAELMAETKTSLEELKISEGMDKQRLAWWMEQAGIKTNNEKNNYNIN